MTAPDPSKPNRTLGPGIALVLATVVVSGVSNFVNFKAVQGTDVDAWIAARNAMVAMLLAPVAFLAGSGPRTRLASRDWVRLAVIGLIGGAIPFVLYFHGFQMAASQGGAAAASFGYRSLFLMASLLGVVVLKERLPRRFVLGAGLLLAGNALLLSLAGPVWTDGTLFVLLATAMWAGEYALSKRALRSLPSGTVALGRMGFGAVFLLAYVGLSGHAASLAAFSGGDGMTLFLSACLLFAFVGTWYAGLKTTDLSVATSLLGSAFPITWVLGVFASGAAFTVGQALGAACVALGVAVVLGVAALRRGATAIPGWLRTRFVRTV